MTARVARPPYDGSQRARTMKGLRLTIYLLVAFVALIALLVYILPFSVNYWLYERPFRRERFNQARWLSAPTSLSEPDPTHNPRGPMAEDLRRHFLHKGMSKASVIRLLGRPSGCGESEGPNEYCYYLGAHGAMSIDGDYLVIHQDRYGRIVSTEIRAD